MKKFLLLSLLLSFGLFGFSHNNRVAVLRLLKDFKALTEKEKLANDGLIKIESQAKGNRDITILGIVSGQLPFIEDWSSGSFATNNWTFDPAQGNWSIITDNGNPAPSARFNWAPGVINYSYALVSPMLDASAIFDNITLKYNIYLSNYSTETIEGIVVEVYDGATWQVVHDYQNTSGSFGWISESFNITQWAAGHTFNVRFRVYGDNSTNINWWYIDNINVFQQVMGNLIGTITKLADGTPIEGATISITNTLGNTYSATTSANGTYTINNAESGIYTLTIEKEGYNIIEDVITIIGNQTITKDYQLTVPSIDVVPNSLTVTVPIGHTTTRELTITNNGSSPFEWNGSIQSNKEQVSIPASEGNFEHAFASTLIGPIVQGKDWNPASDNISHTAYNASTGGSKLHFLDNTTRNTEVLDYFAGKTDALTYPSADSSWTSLEPNSGVIAAGQSQTAIVSFYGGFIPPQKDYILTGDITFTSNPNVGTVMVPITFTIQSNGILTGTITYNGQPMDSVIITAQNQDNNYNTTSDADGVYTFPQILDGEYAVSAEATGYNLFSTTGVVITGGQTTNLDIVLTSQMVITPQSLSVTIPQNTVTERTINIANTGDYTLEWSSALVINEKQSATHLQLITESGVGGNETGEVSPINNKIVGSPIRALWEVLFTFNGNYGSQPGIETDGQYIYTSSSAYGHGKWFHKYALDGTWIEDFNIPLVNGISEMAYDGQYFYGLQDFGTTIYQMDFTNKVLIGTINTPVYISNIAYDSQADGFWVNWASTDFYLVDRSGAVIKTVSNGLTGIKGSAYDPWTAGGPYLWLFNGPGADILQYSIATESLTGVMHDASDIPGFSSGSIGGLCISDMVVPGKIVLIGSIQQWPVLIFGYDLGENWITSSPKSGTLVPDSVQDVIIHLNTTYLSEGTYTASINFTNNLNVDTVAIPVTLNIIPQPILTIDTITIVEAGTVSVPVHAAKIVNMSSFQFSIEYDPTLLTFNGTSNWYTGIDTVTVGNPSPGHLTFVWSAEMSGVTITDSNFFDIDFTWIGAPGQTSPLVWSDDPTSREFKDLDGNILGPGYVNGGITRFAPIHFDFEGGNAVDPVWTIYLSQATLDDIDLQPLDEIAIFDSTTMVGAFRLTEVLTPENFTDNYITAFKTLTNGSGYIPGHSYSFKCWDVSAQTEIDYVNVFLLNPWGDAYTGNVFPENDGEYSIANLDFLTKITLNFGYQFISSYITPTNPDMSAVLAELKNNNLSFVRNSAGDMFRKLGPNWVNNIGDWIVTEGYLFKMNAPDDFSITGTPVNPQTPINLNTGYQLISYLQNYFMNATRAFAGIMNDNLNFIRNSGGDMLRKLGPNWVNNIGNVNPGEGYLVKMNAPSTLIYPAGTKSESTKKNLTIQHFSFEGGNAADPVYTIYISDATINGYSLQAGDEIGVFDGQTLVGSLVLTQIPTPENQTENAIPVFATLNSGEGFTANHPVTFKLWSASHGMEYDGITAAMSNPYGDAYTGNVFPNSDGVYSIASLTTTLTGINNLGLSEIAVYPNPNNGTFTLEFKSAQLQALDVKVYNSLGVVVYQQLNVVANGKYSIEIGLSDLPEGIYTLNAINKDACYIRKMVIKR